MVASCRHLAGMPNASGSQLGKEKYLPPMEYLEIYAGIFGRHNWGVGIGQGATGM